jgi:hypothetical protein
LMRLLALAMAVTVALLVVASPAGSRIIKLIGFDREIEDNAERMLAEGRQTFRFDTFGDEAFWGGMLQLHRAIAGAEFGGVPGLIRPSLAEVQPAGPVRSHHGQPPPFVVKCQLLQAVTDGTCARERAWAAPRSSRR